MEAVIADRTDTKPKSKVGYLWLLLVAGLAGLAGLFANNRSLDTRPVYLPLPTQANETAEATFAPTTTNVYELELEIRAPANREVFDTTVRDVKKGGLPGTWSVAIEGQPKAKGRLDNYLYTSMTGPYRRRARQVVGLESYRNISAPRMARGVGRFKAKAGQEVLVRVKLSAAIPDDVATAESHLVVRVNRREVADYLSRSVVLAGLCACICLVPICASLKRRITRKP